VTVRRPAAVDTSPRPVAVTATALSPALLLPPPLLLLAVLMTMMVDGETAAALADVHGHVVGVGLVAAGPREARRQTQDLVVFRSQRVLLLPAVHAGVDDGHLVLGVEEHVLAALVRRVDELERQSTCGETFSHVFTARRYAKRGICRRRVSVCLSVCLCVCHTLVLRENG